MQLTYAAFVGYCNASNRVRRMLDGDSSPQQAAQDRADDQVEETKRELLIGMYLAGDGYV